MNHGLEKKTFEEVKNLLNAKEGLVFMGCGGRALDWVEEISNMLSKNNMCPPVENWYKLITSGGRIDLIMPFPEDGVQIGRLAMWKLVYGDTSWWSDYVVNYEDQHSLRIE